jgi:hypothetical protein
MNIVVANTKGGAGKTTIALNVLPVLLKQKNPDLSITYYQLDDNNEVITKSDNVEIKTYKLDETNQAVDEVMLNNLLGAENQVNIIDCGGGNDTKIVIKNLADNGIKDNIFTVPLNQNLSIKKNVIDTIELINENFENPTIYLFLNNVFNPKDIEKEFINVFGDKDFGIEPLNFKKLNIKGLGVVPFLNFLQILELKKQILLDKYIDAKKAFENEEKVTKELAEKLDEKVKKGEITKQEMMKEFSEFRDLIRNAKRIVQDTEIIISANEKFLNNL